jgi:outer membrane protein assembly factor BamB
VSRQTPSTEGLFLKKNAFFLSVCLCGTLWIIVLMWWIVYDPAKHLSASVPGMDQEPPGASLIPAVRTDNVRIGEFFRLFDGIASSIPGRWPRFRGTRFDNISTETSPLRNAFDSSPPILWEVALGEGHAAPAVANGRVFVLDYDEKENADALRCFSLTDGREIWRRWYKVKVKRNHGMSRTIPAVSDSFVVTIGPLCHVMCVRPQSGDFLWGMDLVEKYGTEVPLWYTGQCPLIDDTVAVISPGGSKLMIGIDCRTGKVLWETPNPRGWKMSHSSIVPMPLKGRVIYLYCASGGIAGVAADGTDRGTILFESSAFNQAVVAPSPVVLDKGRIFITAGYGAGSMLFEVTHTNGSFSIAPVKKIEIGKGPSSEQQTPLYYKGHLFMVLPKDAGELKGQFVCVHPDNIVKTVWSSGPEKRFGLGPYLIADNKVYLLNDNGMLTVAQASTDRFVELGATLIMKGIDAWGPMALVSGRLLVRDAKRMMCVDIRAR